MSTSKQLYNNTVVCILFLDAWMDHPRYQVYAVLIAKAQEYQ